ncbi:hypothetical protein RHGRI_033940 [Rhododendron griersonianum]|uniref:Uncharacterized protein n=1 Tax=Rhododendron griersonianum TaxID=479676 RepID=A0AAV6I1P9_9ERIC|nr:hypothetical protein RHGRI_033940 [Rhododendron griersonianum]
MFFLSIRISLPFDRLTTKQLSQFAICKQAFDYFSGSEKVMYLVAIWDVNKGQRLHSFSPAVFLSAGMNNKGNVLLSGPRASGNGCAIDSPNILCGSAHYAMYSTLAGVILSAGVNRKGNVLLSGYDRRVGREIPVICAEWRWRQIGRVVVFDYGEKVYVMDDATGGALVVVGDVRNAKMPLLEDRNGV